MCWVYYECLLRLVNYLQVRTTKKIHHYFQGRFSGPISLSYNALLTTLEANIIVKPIVIVVIAKSTLTCTNCGKTSHTLKTCHNKKGEVLVVPTAIIKSIEPIIKTKTQLAKLGRIPIHYPYIICSNVKHRFGECLKKIEV